MLAIQIIHIVWYKSDRTAKGAELRKNIGQPEKMIKNFISDDESNVIFLSKNKYFQQGRKFKSNEEYSKDCFENLNFINEASARQCYRNMQKAIQLNKGAFSNDIEHFNKSPHSAIPCVNIKKSNNDYNIIWYSDLNCLPIRKGRNEKYFSHTHFQYRNAVNYKVFTLKTGESGKLQYNYRYVEHETGIWQYNMVYVYLVNTDENIIKQDIFTETDYKYEYKNLAKLF